MGDHDWAAEGHCVTLLSGITPVALIAALGARTEAQVRGVDALAESTAARWDAGYNPDEAVLGVADAGAGWSVIVEVNGYLGVTEAVIGPLSGARTIVAHFRNVNAVQRFHWWRDGRLLVDVDLLFPEDRFGAEPEALADFLRDVPLDDPLTAGFTIAERITGVHCGPPLFTDAGFVVAIAAVPGHAEQQRYGDALRRDWRAPDL